MAHAIQSPDARCEVLAGVVLELCPSPPVAQAKIAEVADTTHEESAEVNTSTDKPLADQGVVHGNKRPVELSRDVSSLIWTQDDVISKQLEKLYLVSTKKIPITANLSLAFVVAFLTDPTLPIYDRGRMIGGIYVYNTGKNGILRRNMRLRIIVNEHEQSRRWS